jgi:hypothetical protein
MKTRGRLVCSIEHGRTGHGRSAPVSPLPRLVRLLVRHVKDCTSLLRFFCPIPLIHSAAQEGGGDDEELGKEEERQQHRRFPFLNVKMSSTNDDDSHTATSFWIRNCE